MDALVALGVLTARIPSLKVPAIDAVAFVRDPPDRLYDISHPHIVFKNPGQFRFFYAAFESASTYRLNQHQGECSAQ
jgi:hypothetical protein